MLTDIQFGLVGQLGQYPRGDLPFELDTEQETPTSAFTKLGTDTNDLSQTPLAKGDRRQSWFLDDARVIELRWRENLIGLEQVAISRLGMPQDFQESNYDDDTATFTGS